MRPVAIFRHSPTEGPGYFATFLDTHRVPWELIAVDAGAPLPATAETYAGLCFMGGPMSVNDPLPWVESVGALIREAVAKDIPVLGHCLGGQLIAKALGGQVTRNPVKEIGWGQATIADNGEARETAGRWFGDLKGEVTVFQWHGETFSLPRGAVRLLGNAYCANQMFALGPHFAMQCHVEMTPEMIATWSTQWAEEAAAAAHLPSAQTPAQMVGDIEAKLPVMRQLADRIYSRWIEGLRG